MKALRSMLSRSSRKDNVLATSGAALEHALAHADDVDLSWLPPATPSLGWPLAADALRFLVQLIEQLRPRHILEFGSGLSTQVMARSGADLPSRCCITSVDHDPVCGKMAEQEYTAQRDQSCRVMFLRAPLVARDCGGKMLPVYHVKPERFASRRPADLIVIDGPPQVLGGREGTLYQAMEFSRPGTLVLLDDAKRIQEQTALARWQDTLGATIEVRQLPGFTKGLAAIIIREPIARTELWSHRLRLTAREVAALIPPDDKFILVGESWWNEEVAPGRHAIPFLEQDGQYGGPPPDDTTAIQELERLRTAGATRIVFGWLYFWWLDYYTEFHSHLRTHYHGVFQNDRLIVFDLNR